jgi:hypothetical protein
MNPFDRTIFFTIAQGEPYEKMAENLFFSLKNKHSNIKTACISYSKIKYCDYVFKISELCPIENNINEAHIHKQSYSFKLGIYEKIPKEFLKNFDKIIFYDSDSICLNSITIDQSILDSNFYVPWCQSIVTQDPLVNKNINLKWEWSGATFKQHSEFAKIHNIKEWKNVNAGMIAISTKELFELIDLYKDWVKKIYKFYGDNHGTEELTFSLMLANLNPEFTMPDICNNRIGQLCMTDTVVNVKYNNFFNYSPWFNSTDKKHYQVIPTCVHFPGQKNKLIYNEK